MQTPAVDSTMTHPPNAPRVEDTAHPLCNEVQLTGFFDGGVKASVTPSGVRAASFWMRTGKEENATRIKVNLYRDIDVLKKLTPRCFLSVKGELMNRAWRGTLFLEVRAKRIDVAPAQPDAPQ